MLFALLLCAGTGCTVTFGISKAINAQFPEVKLKTPRSAGIKIGLARVEDSRNTREVNEGSNQIPLLAGPEFYEFIDHTFRNRLIQRGFDPTDALDPTKTLLLQPYKTMVVTLQSVSFVCNGMFSCDGTSNVSLAMQVFAPDRSAIFSGSFEGQSNQNDRLDAGIANVNIIAKAAERAIDAAFANPKFEAALK
ncbi:MAG TPA: hypothetical protein VMT58_02150 [Candidatus Binataceae bacterium]|nr:hypothetical protein [Candidatus Binataceae bacterium]